MHYMVARAKFPVDSLVNVSYRPGVWRVNQLVGIQSDVHLVPADDTARVALGAQCSLIVFADDCTPATEA